MKKICFFILSLISMASANQDIQKKLENFKSRAIELISSDNDINPSIYVQNGIMIYSNNFSEYKPEYNTNIPLVNIEREILFDLKTYFVIHLGLVDTKWDTEMYTHFTTTIDNSKKQKNLLGFTIGSNFANGQNENLPFLKASIRDLKQYMIFKKLGKVPIGVKLDENSYNISISSSINEYFKCNNKYNLDFYYYNKTVIPNSNIKTSRSTNITVDCTDIDIDGIEASFLPYSPRSSRCDCILSALSCIVNPSSNFDFNGDLTVLENICETVSCTSIENNSIKGIYGIFASCTNVQRYSIAFNLYYTLHENKTEYCNFNGMAKIIPKNSSIDKYMNLIDFDGKECGEEILEDWNKYLVGKTRSSANVTIPSREQVYDYEKDFKDTNSSAPTYRIFGRLDFVIFYFLLFYFFLDFI